MKKNFIKLSAFIILCTFTFFSVNAQQLNLTNDNVFIQNLLNQGLKGQLSQFVEDNYFQDEPIAEDKKNSFDKDEIEALRKLYIKRLQNTSTLEKEYSLRSNTELRLQGYDIFEKLYETTFSTTFSDTPRRKGAIQDDYIIGPGDEIILRLQGEINRTIQRKVSINGELVYSFTPPILAFGIKFGELKKEIQRRVKSSFVETEAYITLDQIKQINVITSGEVNLPSQYQVSSLSNVLDVMLTTGGIKKTGSLRNIIHIANGREEIVDLYDILYGFYKNDKDPIYVKNGSRLIVPSITNTVAVAGNVVNPGIYEIKENEFTIKDIFTLSGKSSFSKKFFVKRINNNKDVIDFKLNENSIVKNGDIIFVIPEEISSEGTVSISGSVKYPFEYPLEEYPKASSIIKGFNFLQNNTFTLSFIIRSFNKNSQKYVYKTHNLLDVLRKKKDITLKNKDEIFIFNNKDLEFLLNEEIVNALNPSYNFSKSNGYICPSIIKLNEHIKATASKNENSYFSIYNSLNKMISETSFIKENSDYDPEFKTKEESNCREIFESNPDLLIEIVKSMVLVRGEVSDPGLYFASKDLSLKSLLVYAGYTEGKILVSPDKRNINVILNNVQLTGSVRFPQKINFNRKISLKQIIPESSYVLPDTYPLFGIIKRRLAKTGVYKFITFNPEEIFSGIKDINLQNGDVIRFFNQQEISTIVESLVLKNKLNLDNIKTNNENVFILDQKQNSNKDKKISAIKNDTNSLNLSKIIEETDFFNTSNNEIFEKYAEILSIDDLETIKLNLQKEKPEIIKSIQKPGINETGDNIDTDDNSTKTTNNSKNSNEKIIVEKTIVENIIRSNLVQLSGRIVLPGFYPVGATAKISSLISIAGGFEKDADKNRIEIRSASNKQVSNQKESIEPGDIVFVNSNNIQKDNIFLTGSIEKERSIGFQKNMNLSDVLLDIKDLKENTFLYFGTIYRYPTEQKPASYKVFSPHKVISGKQIIKLNKGDVITFYSSEDIKLMLEQKQIRGTNTETLMHQVIDKFSVNIKGSVKSPGKLLLGAKYNFEEIINIAGGFTNDSDLANLDILYPVKQVDGNISFKQKFLNFDTKGRFEIAEFGTVIRVPTFTNEINLGQIQVLGAVKSPGNYQILKNDTIYTLIKRSGGLNRNAFLDGLVFSRLEEKEREKKSLDRLKNELEKSISLSLERIGSKTDISSLAGVKEIISLASEAEPIGRIVGDFTNINLLKKTLVADGDTIFIPRKPTSITIVGETLSPGSILWNQNNTVDEYLESVAGFTELADKKRIFLIEPNGKSKRISGFWKSNLVVKPGSTLVVPRRIVLASNLERISAVTSIIYQLTLSLAGIEGVLND